MSDNQAAKKRDSRPDILFISGSPRSHTCVALIGLLEQGAKKAGAKTQRFLLSKKHIYPCNGCGSCSTTGNCVLAAKTREGRFADDYLELKAVLERVDAVAIVAPLYFAGPPAQFKALLDRMQPYWAQRYLLGYPVREKRPVQLFVVGGGNDEHGFAPLAGTTKSAMAVAGFNLEKVNNFVGFLAPKDVPAFPSADGLGQYSHAQIAQLKRAIAQQEGMVQRAIDAGGAFARFVVKKGQANDLAQQLAVVHAELEDLKRIGDVEANDAASAAQPAPVLPRPGRGGAGMDAKGSLRAGIDLDYSDLISRTPRDVAAVARGGELADAALDAPSADAAAGPDAAAEGVVDANAAVAADAGVDANVVVATTVDVDANAGAATAAPSAAADAAAAKPAAGGARLQDEEA
jgi:multimeric flavodoxin WrbA